MIFSCGIVILCSSPAINTCFKTVFIIFKIFTFFLFGLLSVLTWVFLNKNYFMLFNTEFIKRFHGIRMTFLGNYTIYIDKVYNLFYVLPFFELVIQLLNL